MPGFAVAKEQLGGAAQAALETAADRRGRCRSTDGSGVTPEKSNADGFVLVRPPAAAHAIMSRTGRRPGNGRRDPVRGIAPIVAVGLSHRLPLQSLATLRALHERTRVRSVAPVGRGVQPGKPHRCRGPSHGWALPRRLRWPRAGFPRPRWRCARCPRSNALDSTGPQWRRSPTGRFRCPCRKARISIASSTAAKSFPAFRRECITQLRDDPRRLVLPAFARNLLGQPEDS